MYKVQIVYKNNNQTDSLLNCQCNFNNCKF